MPGDMNFSEWYAQRSRQNENPNTEIYHECDGANFDEPRDCYQNEPYNRDFEGNGNGPPRPFMDDVHDQMSGRPPPWPQQERGGYFEESERGFGPQDRHHEMERGRDFGGYQEEQPGYGGHDERDDNYTTGDGGSVYEGTKTDTPISEPQVTQSKPDNDDKVETTQENQPQEGAEVSQKPIEAQVKVTDKEQEAERGNLEKSLKPIDIESYRDQFPQEFGIQGNFCEICQIETTSAVAMRNHLNGKAHKNKAMAFESGRNKGGATESGENSIPEVFGEAFGEHANTTFCHLCQVQTTSAFNMSQHLKGKSHRAKVLAFESGRNDVSQPNDTEQEVKKSTFVANLESIDEEKKMQDDTYEEYTDECANGHFCDLCEVETSSAANMRDHLKGKTHRANLLAVESGRFPRAKAKKMVDMSNFGKESSVLEEAKQSGKPVIGLQHVTEYHSTVGIVCLCHLCGVKLPIENSLMHILGFKHRLRYLKEHHPDRYTYVKQFELKRPEVLKYVDKQTAELFDTEGSGTPVLKCRPNGSNNAEDEEIPENTDWIDQEIQEVMDTFAKKKAPSPPPATTKATQEEESAAHDAEQAQADIPKHRGGRKGGPPDEERLNQPRGPRHRGSSRGPPDDRFGPPGDRFGPWDDRYGPPDDRFGPPDERYDRMRPRPHDPFDRYGPPPGPLHNRYGPPHDRYGPPPPFPEDPYGPPRRGYESRYGPPPLPPPPDRYLPPTPYAPPPPVALPPPSHPAYPPRPDYLDRARQPEPYLDPDPTKRVRKIAEPYLDPDPTKRIRRSDEPYMDPDPTKRIRPSQTSVVFDYGHGGEKPNVKGSKNKSKTESWEDDLQDIIGSSKKSAPDSLSILSSSYSSPKREKSPKPSKPSKPLPFSKSYLEISKKARKRSRSPDEYMGERRRRSDDTRMPSRQRRSQSPSHYRSDGRCGRDPPHRGQWNTRGADPPHRGQWNTRGAFSSRYRRSRSNSRSRQRSRSRSGSKTRIKIWSPRKAGFRTRTLRRSRSRSGSRRQRRRSRSKSSSSSSSRSSSSSSSSSSNERQQKLKEKRAQALVSIRPKLEEESDGDVEIVKIERPASQRTPEHLEQISSDNMSEEEKEPEREAASKAKAEEEDDDAKAERIANLLLKMSSAMTGQADSDAQATLQALLSSEVTKTLLSAKQKMQQDEGGDEDDDDDHQDSYVPDRAPPKAPTREKIAFSFSDRHHGVPLPRTANFDDESDEND